jgi:hypothetical protein
MDNTLKIALILIFLILMIPLVIIYRAYSNYKKAKKSWKVLYIAEMDTLKTMEYNFKHGIFRNKLFIILLITIYPFGIIWGIIQKDILYVAFNVLCLLCLIGLYLMPNMMKKLNKPMLKKVSICDKGIIYNRDKGINTWDKFKGYKVDDKYIYLIAKELNRAIALKYSKELENIIKGFLRRILEST